MGSTILERIRTRRTLVDMMPLLTLLGLVILFSIVSPWFFSVANLQNLLRHSAVLLVVAIGETFVILMGSFDVSVGALVTVGAVTTAVLAPTIGLGAPLVAVAGGLLIGVISGCIFVFGKIPSFLVTLGMWTLLDGIALIITKGSSILIYNEAVLALSIGSVMGVPHIAIWSLGVFGVMSYIGMRTRFGRYLYAIGGGERVARLSGVPVGKYKIFSFALCGLLSTLAGVLLASRMQAGNAGIGSPYLIDGLAAVVMGGTPPTGGVGGVHRTILGVLVIAVLSNGLNLIGVDPYVQMTIKGMVIILAVALSLDRTKISVFK